MKTKITWYSKETCGLVNKETGNMFFGADQEKYLDETLERMTPEHPLYPKLVKVHRNGDEAVTEVELN